MVVNCGFETRGPLRSSCWWLLLPPVAGTFDPGGAYGCLWSVPAAAAVKGCFAAGLRSSFSRQAGVDLAARSATRNSQHPGAAGATAVQSWPRVLQHVPMPGWTGSPYVPRNPWVFRARRALAPGCPFAPAKSWHFSQPICAAASFVGQAGVRTGVSPRRRATRQAGWSEPSCHPAGWSEPSCHPAGWSEPSCHPARCRLE